MAFPLRRWLALLLACSLALAAGGCGRKAKPEPRVSEGAAAKHTI